MASTHTHACTHPHTYLHKPTSRSKKHVENCAGGLRPGECAAIVQVPFDTPPDAPISVLGSCQEPKCDVVLQVSQGVGTLWYPKVWTASLLLQQIAEQCSNRTTNVTWNTVSQRGRGWRSQCTRPCATRYTLPAWCLLRQPRPHLHSTVSSCMPAPDFLRR
jgi:hypothetical protein